MERPLIKKSANGNYIFENIEYQGKPIAVELDAEIIHNENRSQEQWANSSKYSIHVIYQILRVLCNARHDAIYKDISMECVAKLRKAFDDYYISAATKLVGKEGLEALISWPEIIPETAAKFSIEIPELNEMHGYMYYIILAKKQPIEKLGNSEPIPQNLKHLLNSIFGYNYELAGEVFQYCSSLLENDYLREVRLWLPNLKKFREMVHTAFKPEFAFALGTDGYERFDVHAFDLMSTERRAFNCTIRALPQPL